MSKITEKAEKDFYENGSKDYTNEAKDSGYHTFMTLATFGMADLFSETVEAVTGVSAFDKDTPMNDAEKAIYDAKWADIAKEEARK